MIEQKPVEQQTEPKEPKKINTVLIIAFLVLIAVLIGVWYWFWTQSNKLEIVQKSNQVSTPEKVEVVSPKEDSVSSINSELEAIETTDLDKEFQEIDNDLNSL